jgi:hypothetical protein
MFHNGRSAVRSILAPSVAAGPPVCSRSEAIPYVQLGNAEAILIDDGTIHDNVMKEYGREDAFDGG